MNPTGHRYFGKYKAFVRDNNDPERRGRVRTFCPQVMGTQDDPSHWLDWAEPSFPWLGGINTLDFGPPLTKIQNGGTETGVWVEFEAGEVDHPIWTGTWLPAPTTTSPNAQVDLSQVALVDGGSITSNPPAGSSLSDLNPPVPQPNTNETRITVKAGREIFIGSDQGGGIVIGPFGVAVEGMQVLVNGKLTSASSNKIVE